jgi:hypothetical protein
MEKGLGFITVTAVMGWNAYRGSLTDTMLIAYFAAVIADDQIGKRQNIHHDLEKKADQHGQRCNNTPGRSP